MCVAVYRFWLLLSHGQVGKDGDIQNCQAQSGNQPTQKHTHASPTSSTSRSPNLAQEAEPRVCVPDRAHSPILVSASRTAEVGHLLRIGHNTQRNTHTARTTSATHITQFLVLCFSLPFLPLGVDVERVHAASDRGTTHVHSNPPFTRSQPTALAIARVVSCVLVC